MTTSKTIFPALLGCLGLWGCDADKTTGTMDETNQSAMARIFAPDRSPASGAVVQVWKGDDTLRTPVTQTVTEDDGSFRIGSLPDGMYRIVARKDGYVAMQDSIPTISGKLSPKNDTLGKPVVMKGRVRMTGSDNPATVTLLVMGTEILANVDKSGTFRIEGLASGSYRLRLSTTLDDYTTTAAAVRLSGRDSCDVGTIRMNFTGIPPVDSLTARVDSTSGSVKLSWSRPDVSDFRFARVYREPLDGSEKPVAVGITTSRTFEDVNPNYGSSAVEWLYTVRIHTMDGDSGYPAWTTVTQRTVKRTDSFMRAWVVGYNPWSTDSLAPESAIDAIIAFGSSPALPRSLYWSFQGRSGFLPLDSMQASSDSITYTLHLQLASTPGTYPFFVRMVAQDGRNVMDSVYVHVRARRDTTIIDTTRHDSTGTVDTVRNDSTSHGGDTTGIDSAKGLLIRTRPFQLDAGAPGSTARIAFLAMSSPDRARHIVWSHGEGATRVTDTISLATMGAAPAGSGWPYVWVDSFVVEFPLETSSGIHRVVATLVGADGQEAADTLTYQIPDATDSVIDSAGSSAATARPAARLHMAEPSRRGTVGARRPTEYAIPSVFRLEEDA